MSQDSIVLPNRAYYRLLSWLKEEGTHEMNARTGVGVTVGFGGHGFKLDLSSGQLPIFGNRRYFPHIAAAEMAWQTQGTKDPEFILRHAPKLWSKFVRDGELETAYGFRWMKHFGRDQIAQVIDCLRNDPTNRQLFVSAWDPKADGLGEENLPPNIPCPVGFAVSRLENRVHMSVFIRSSDVFVGLPYDVMCYALTLDALAASAGCKPGAIHFTLAHPHFYDPHAEFIDESLSFAHGDWLKPAEIDLRMPQWTWQQIAGNPEGYVMLIKELQRPLKRHSFSPLPEVVL